ncbi:hypothetical protein CIPAW_05G247300 [Carya illinoinensis]|uniref:Uncharacterized protein n=1 Tax=Carya illinoinensis TaxID=32201 RepID=A0A8T1QN25_CARIL|nr:hypothetical protein CIPAW_05G247300 [Carya illinoinensis]
MTRLGPCIFIPLNPRVIYAFKITSRQNREIFKYDISAGEALQVQNIIHFGYNYNALKLKFHPRAHQVKSHDWPPNIRMRSIPKYVSINNYNYVGNSL